MKIKSNYQDFLKLLALICMVIDHLGLYFFPEVMVARSIGRYAMPIFCFFAGYNFKDTPRIKILFYGILLYCFSRFLISEELSVANILISIFLGQNYIWFFQKLSERHWQSFGTSYFHIIILASMWGLTHNYIEYGTLSIAIMLIGYVAKKEPNRLKLLAAVASFFSLLHSLVVFDAFFEPLHVFIVIIISVMIYISLTVINLGCKISWNIAFITRNMLEFYCLHLVIIESYWRYYLNG
jgi:hypothetical protein